MIDYETYQRIKHLHKQEHLSAMQIATAVQLDYRTVIKWLKASRFHPRQSTARQSLLDPYKDQLVQWLEHHPYTAQQCFQRLREQGYPGGYSILKDYIRTVRPVRKPAFLTLAFAPGECAQVDWGTQGTIAVGATRRRLSFFVMVLCYSRLMYVEFTVSQTMEHFLACHQNAFEYFGQRVPGDIMVDNLRSAVLKRIVGEAPVFNPKYQAFADHYGFTIKACGVGKGNEKERVENGVGYVKKNLLNGLTLGDFSSLQPAARSGSMRSPMSACTARHGSAPSIVLPMRRPPCHLLRCQPLTLPRFIHCVPPTSSA
jgi:transposase